MEGKGTRGQHRPKNGNREPWSSQRKTHVYGSASKILLQALQCCLYSRITADSEQQTHLQTVNSRITEDSYTPKNGKKAEYGKEVSLKIASDVQKTEDMLHVRKRHQLVCIVCALTGLYSVFMLQTSLYSVRIEWFV